MKPAPPLRERRGREEKKKIGDCQGKVREGEIEKESGRETERTRERERERERERRG